MSEKRELEFQFDERSLDSIQRIKEQGHAVYPERTMDTMSAEINDLQDEILRLEAGQQQQSMLHKAECAGLEGQVRTLARLLNEWVGWAKLYHVWDHVSNTAAVSCHTNILQSENRLAYFRKLRAEGITEADMAETNFRIEDKEL